MKLNIRNFAKIKEADILVDGITVIAGENNTGKSTVGKIVFSLFNALSGVEDEIRDERLKEMEYSNRFILQNYINGTGKSRITTTQNIYRLSKRISECIGNLLKEHDDISEQVIRQSVETEWNLFSRVVHIVKEETERNIIDEIAENISEILKLPEQTIVLEVISRYFNNVFYSQINPLSENVDDETTVELEIKGKRNKIWFSDNKCKEFESEIDILHKAIYIDNPFIIDNLSEYNGTLMDELLRSLLTKSLNKKAVDGVVETVRVREKLDDIFKALKEVVDGEIVTDREDFYLKNDNLSKPILLNNLSTGMKSFVILKMLLENGCISEKDVVILDEPEIHLHPQWQIVYAQMIVLLKKTFDLSVIVTTHSPYFVDALNLFSCEYGIDKKVNYYLSSLCGNTVKMDCVTDEIDLIYKKMASPIQMLDTLRHELNNC